MNVQSILTNPTPRDIKQYVIYAMNTGEKINFDSAVVLAAIAFGTNAHIVRSAVYGNQELPEIVEAMRIPTIH